MLFCMAHFSNECCRVPHNRREGAITTPSVQDPCCNGCSQLPVTGSDHQLNNHYQHQAVSSTEDGPQQHIVQQLNHLAAEGQQQEQLQPEEAFAPAKHGTHHHQPASALTPPVRGGGFSLATEQPACESAVDGSTSSTSSGPVLDDASASSSSSSRVEVSTSLVESISSNRSQDNRVTGRSKRKQRPGSSSSSSSSTKVAAPGRSPAASPSPSRAETGSGLGSSRSAAESSARKARQESNEQASTSGRWVGPQVAGWW